LGLLAKGPIIIILTGPPIFIWCLLGKNRFKDLFTKLGKNRFKDLFTKLPWLLGLLITALVALPWYYLMEQRSPGFIDYFIVGEHFKRFVVSGWTGDLYGTGHSQPKGMIWLFLLAFAFPWVQVVQKYFKKQMGFLFNVLDALDTIILYNIK
jgi:4-amino-4-deoxy-L-arabinose transferase-like glycosyltransferase